ncbi:MAG: pantetheine-phosphate adenylyltransferase [Clostridia bacterium]|nr:pantetheine-phosphate adenylyltransferase [Clostridia bacterium]
MRIAVYPGSFDPLTNGHLNIIKRASRLYDKVIVGVLDNSSKNPIFTAEERKEMIDKAVADIKNVSCYAFSGLLVDFAKQNNATVIIKGLRTVADFEYEFQIALLNKALNPEYETVFMMTDSKYSYISSSVVKEVAKYQGELGDFVPICNIEKIKTKFKNIK